MLPSHARTKPTRNLLVIDWDCLYDPFTPPRDNGPLYPGDWNWPDRFLPALQQLAQHFDITLFHHFCYVQNGEMEALGFMEKWVKRQLAAHDLKAQTVNILAQYASPNHVRALLPSNPSLQSWWISNKPYTVRIADELNFNTCLLFSPFWSRPDLELQNAVIPSIISESLFHFSEEILQELAKPATTS